MINADSFQINIVFFDPLIKIINKFMSVIAEYFYFNYCSKIATIFKNLKPQKCNQTAHIFSFISADKDAPTDAKGPSKGLKIKMKKKE